MELVINSKGIARMVYQEEIGLAALGPYSIQRASQVEPDDNGQWWADLRSSAGPILGPFLLRTDAIRAETEWIALRLATTFEVIPS